MGKRSWGSFKTLQDDPSAQRVILKHCYGLEVLEEMDYSRSVVGLVQDKSGLPCHPR